MAKDYRNSNIAGLTRGFRNNNPGNLRRANIDWQGKVPFSNSTDKDFEQFINIHYGLRALMRDIVSDIKGGKNNIIALINEFAPGFENNTPAYIKAVVQLAGIPANAILDLSQETVIGLAKAIVRVETNAKDAALLTQADYDAAMKLNADLKLKKKIIPQK